MTEHRNPEIETERTDETETFADAPEGTADEAPAVTHDPAVLAAELEALKQQLRESQDRYLRQAAEFQNYRRRKEQEALMLVADGKAAVLRPVLDLMDDFGRTLEAARQVDPEKTPEAFEQLRQGIGLVHTKFLESLGRLGVEPIEAVGKPFHEDEHEALMQQPAPEGTEPGVVLGELQKGYRLGDKILRYSKVIVAA